MVAIRNIVLPKNVEFIIDRLNAYGYRADVVGGAIRDLYIGREAGDYDITTAASPDKIKEIFSDVRTIDTGIKHGTVTVHLDGENYELTTYRRDGEYKDARHPESVEFTTELKEDLSRRDFTINAICFNYKDGITDIFGGCDDIETRIVRTVGKAEERFSEDALRILRALRFASVLDFDIEESTKEAVHKLRGLLGMVSRERVYTEWHKLCSGRGAHRIISEYKDVVSEFIPGLGDFDLPSEELFLKSDTVTRMLSLFVGKGKDAPDHFDNSMRNLKTDNKIRLFGNAVLSLYVDFYPSSVEDILFALSEYGDEPTVGAIRLGCLTERFGESEEKLLLTAKSSGIPYKLGDLAIGGSDLVMLGLKGERIGKTLAELLRAVMSGKCKNGREELLSYVSRQI